MVNAPLLHTVLALREVGTVVVTLAIIMDGVKGIPALNKNCVKETA